MSGKKVEQQQGFILHRRAYRETSLLVEIFTRDYGRLTLIAKGCRRKKSRSQGLFLPFIPLLLSWTGRGELPILTSIEQIGFAPRLSGKAINCGFYINELILKLLHRFDAHERLFVKYKELMFSLMNGENAFSVLRVFEKHLLREIGFGLVLDHDVETGEAIKSNKNYCYHPARGPILQESENGEAVSGATLIALHKEKFLTEQDRFQAKILTRHLIDLQLNGKTLRTRRVMREIRRFENNLQGTIS